MASTRWEGGAEGPEYLMMPIGRILILCRGCAVATLAHVFQPTHSLHYLRELSICTRHDADFSGMRDCFRKRICTYACIKYKGVQRATCNLDLQRLSSQAWVRERCCTGVCNPDWSGYLGDTT